VQRVVVDANVFLSTLVHRNDEQRAAAKALLLKAEDGELEVILPQFVVFEIVYVLQSTYRIPASALAPMLRDLIALPGVLVIDECPWKRVLDYWPPRSPRSPTRRSPPSPPATDTTPSPPSTRSSRSARKTSASPRTGNHQ
jgi:hypothetical protein